MPKLTAIPDLIVHEKERNSPSPIGEDLVKFEFTFDEIDVSFNRSEYLQIIKHGIQQFGFTEEELRDGK